MAISQVFRELACKPIGLTEAEAQQRLERFGPNCLPQLRGPGPLRRLLAQFDNVLIYVLLAAAAVTTALAHWVDTAVILGVVVINAVLGFVQEGKAERALDAIRNMLSPQAIAVRGGQRLDRAGRGAGAGRSGVPAIGRSGARRSAPRPRPGPADAGGGAHGRVAAGREAGRSRSPIEAPLGDRTSMAYSGTLVTHGQGTGIVVATGTATEIGRISGLLAQVEPLTTPLLRQMARFARWLTGAILALAALTVAFGVLVHGYGLGEMFLAAVALAVAAIPEGLPAVLTITLAIGVERMARRNAIIRRLPAVETLGSVTVICSDKTGTLTKNEMTAQAVATAEHLFEVSGVGYDPHGAFSLAGGDAAAVEPETSAAARGRDPGGGAVQRGDAAPGGGRRLGRGRRSHRGRAAHGRAQGGSGPRVRARGVPADGHHSRSNPSTASWRPCTTTTGAGLHLRQGRARALLGMCARERTAERGDRPLDASYWHRRVEELAARGQRILAVATKAVRGRSSRAEIRRH